MTGSAIAAVVLGLVFPGVGQGLAAHRVRGIVWAVAAVATTWLIVVTVWFLPITLLVRLTCAVDAYRWLRRATPPEHLVSAAIALVIGAVGIGGAQVALDAYKIPSSSMYPTLVIGDHIYIDKLSVKWREPARGEIIVFDQPCAHRAYIKRVVAVGGDTVEVRCSALFINGIGVPRTVIDPKAVYEDHIEGDGWKSYAAVRIREGLAGHTYDTFNSLADTTRGDFPQLDRLLAPSCTQSDFFRDGPQSQNKQPQGQIVVAKQDASPCEAQVHFVVPRGSVFVMGDNRHNANDSRYWGVVPLDHVTGRAIGIYLSDGPAGSWSRFGAIE